MEDNWDSEMDGSSGGGAPARSAPVTYSQPEYGGSRNSWEDRNNGDRGGGQRGWGRGRSSYRGRSSDAMPASNRGRGSYQSRDHGDAPLTMSVSSRHVGRIIGRGGSKIKELESMSSARIKVDRGDGDESTVNIYGSEEARNAAYDMVKELVSETGNSYNTRGGGGGGGGSNVYYKQHGYNN